MPAEAAFQKPGPSLLLSEVVIRAVEPVLARRRENVHVKSILERLGLVRNVRRKHEHLARAHDDGLGILGADPKLQGALEHVGQLLVLVMVQRNDAAFLHVHVREHGLVARDDAAVEKIGEFFLGKIIPTDMPNVTAICHKSSFESAAYVT